MNPVEIARSSMWEHFDNNGSYEANGQLVTPGGEVVYMDHQGTIRTVKEVGSGLREGIKKALKCAREHFNTTLINNNSQELRRRSMQRREQSVRSQIPDNVRDDGDMDTIAEDFSGFFQKSATLEDLSQSLGEKVRKKLLNEISKLQIMSKKENGVNEPRTELARHVLKDLFEYGFVRLASDEERKNRFDIVAQEKTNNCFGEDIAYKTKIGDGHEKTYITTADAFLKSLHIGDKSD
nr:hypothetical protein [Endozoicomonas sp.]